MTLLEKVKANTVEVGDCWEWLGAYTDKVPRVRYGDKMMAVRRALVLHAGTKLSGGDYVTCGCGNWRCVNPEHSKLTKRVTHLRKIGGTPSATKTAHAQAMGVGRAALTPELAREVRLSNETGEAIAKRLGVSSSVISKIRRGEGYLSGNIWAGLIR